MGTYIIVNLIIPSKHGLWLRFGITKKLFFTLPPPKWGLIEGNTCTDNGIDILLGIDITEPYRSELSHIVI